LQVSVLDEMLDNLLHIKLPVLKVFLWLADEPAAKIGDLINQVA
jgi:hypothetical protein